MTASNLPARMLRKFSSIFGRYGGMAFDFEGARLSENARADLVKNSKTDLAKIVFGHKGKPVHKWTHFPDIYTRYLEAYRGRDIGMLEIGVFKGGSLQIWREYLGEEARITGVDINPDCADLGEGKSKVFIGSQNDPAFLKDVVGKMGGIDIVLDDGSHVAEHQETSFRTLWPLLNEGGLYILEDTHTAYWPDVFNGGYQRPGTAIEIAKTMVDDMHSWYHTKPNKFIDQSEVLGIHFYDSLIFIEKRTKTPPQHIELG